jgi:hypothetical protein
LTKRHTKYIDGKRHTNILSEKDIPSEENKPLGIKKQVPLLTGGALAFLDLQVIDFELCNRMKGQAKSCA